MIFRLCIVLLVAGGLAVAQGPSLDVLQAHIAANRLISPPENNAWTTWEAMRAAGASEAQLKAARGMLLIALREAGDRLLGKYMEPGSDGRAGSPTAPMEGMTTGDFDLAATLFERAAQLAPEQGALRARAKFARGRALVSQGNWREAEALLLESRALDPSLAYSHNALGIVYLATGRTEDAIFSFNAAVERAPRWVYARHNLALAYFNQKRFAEAEREWVVASAQEPRLSFLHVNLGVLYLRMGRRLDAERELEHALQLDPNGAVTNHNLGVLYETGKRLPEAEASYRKAIAADPSRISARMNLVQLYRREGRNEDAIRELRSALVQDPKNAAVYETLGEVYAAQGNTTVALESYRQALSRVSETADRARIQKKITTLSEK